MDKLDKQLIGQRFRKSLSSYTEAASVQRETAGRLATLLHSLAGNVFNRVFEIGCGTGAMTEIMHKQCKIKELFINDLLEECRVHVERLAPCTFLAGDIEKITGLPERLDLIVSNVTFQWLENPAATFAKLSRLLNPGGILAFSTFGPENLTEIAAVSNIKLHYLPTAAMVAMIEKNYTVKTCEETIRKLYFPSPIEVLKHLKMTGVTGIRKVVWSKSKLEHFTAVYQQLFHTAGGVSLTYHPVVVIAEKTEPSRTIRSGLS